MALTPHLLPLRPIGKVDARVAIGIHMHFGHLDPVGDVEKLDIYFRAADHGNVRRVGEADRLVHTSGDLRPVLFPCGIAGQDDVSSPFELARQAFKRPAPHDHRRALRQRLEMPQVGGKVPGQASPMAYNAVVGAGEDEHDFWMAVGHWRLVTSPAW
jgi:hypothetical protein